MQCKFDLIWILVLALILKDDFIVGAKVEDENNPEDNKTASQAPTDYLKTLTAIADIISANGFVKKLYEKLAPAIPIPGVKSAIDLFIETEVERFDHSFNETIFKANKTLTKLDEVKKMLGGIEGSLAHIDSTLSTLSSHLTKEIKFVNFNNNYVSMTSSIAQFQKNILGFSGGRQQLLFALNKFIEHYENQNYEDKMIRFAVEGFAGQEPMVNSFIESLLIEEKNPETKMMGSTMQLVYEFYLTILDKITKGDAVMNFCYTLRHKLLNRNNYRRGKLRIKRRSSVSAEFFKSLIESLGRVNGTQHRATYPNLSRDVKEVKLKNVIQYFWKNEFDLSGNKTCSNDCTMFNNNKYDDDNGCSGAVRNCEYGFASRTTEYQYLSKDVDRIYDGYSFAGTWFGKKVNPDPSSILKNSWIGSVDPPPGYSKLSGYTKNLIYSCDVCRCVCDQFDNSRATRKVYTGKMNAPEGYVITGARFKESEDGIIYMQIQVGKLMPLGMIDQATVEWQKLPAEQDSNLNSTKALSASKESLEKHDDDPTKSFYEFNYDKSIMLISDAIFKESVLAGFQFFENQQVLSFRVFGKKFKNFVYGTLSEREVTSNAVYYPDISFQNVNKQEFKKPGLKGSSEYTITKNQLINFGMSHEKSDAGQTFVPHFDGIDVTMDSKSPLSGIGLFHFTDNTRYAGYIKPYLFTLNQNDYVIKGIE